MEEECNIRFSLQTCRRTFGQQYLDGFVRAGIQNEEAEIEVVSSMMGHATTKTTEEYYCRIKNSRAVSKARKIWSDADELRNSSQNGGKNVQPPGFEPG